MWIFKGNILDYLRDENVSKDKKRNAFIKNKKRVSKELNKLNEDDLIVLLFNKKTIEEVRKFICDEILSLSKETDSSSKERYKRLTDSFIKRYGKSHSMLTNDLCPIDFKKKIIDISFGSNLIDTIESKGISEKKKEVIIELKLSSKDAVSLLKRNNINKDLQKYIIDKIINDRFEIESILREDDISLDIKEYTALHKVDMSNIFKIIHLSFHGEKELLYRIKARDIDDYIKGLTSNDVLIPFTDYDIPDELIKRIVDEKETVILEGIKKCEKKVLSDILRYERNFFIIDLVLKERPDTVEEIVKELTKNGILSFLNRKYIPENLKRFAIDYHKNLLIDAIKSERLSSIDLYYLGKDSYIPEDIKKRLFLEHKEEYKEKFLNYTKDKVLSEIRYSSNRYLDLTLLLIELRVDENNIFEVLSQPYLDESIIELIFKTKSNVLDKYIEKLTVDDIFRLKKIDVPKDIKNKIIREHKDTVLKLLKETDKDVLFNNLSDNRVLIETKKVILECFDIEEDDVKNCLLSMDASKIKLLIENYKTIKDFIEKSDINFESFLQYGSGSKKHANWIENIIEVNEDKDFIKCKDYFFNYYYTEDNEKENAVYIISNYLEFLENYCKYKDLFLYLCNAKPDLSNTDKNNLKFLFSIKDIDDKNIPNNLEDLELFREYIFEEYKEKFINGELSYDDKKKFFNDLLFSGSKEILENIGGSGALRTIKKDNDNSKYISSLVDDLMLYSRLIELVNDSNNEESINKLLEYVFSDLSIFTKMQNLFSSYDKNVLRLYEEDSINNLTRLEDVRNIDGVLREDLCLIYGAYVFDFSDKNYCLYAHVLSSKEDINDMLSGKSNGNSNFISVSPISYRGQKYYWDSNELILAYDKIPNGSFICSSTDNMATNSRVSKNCSEVSEFSRSQRGILETSTAVENNSETLLYREGLRPCGLILPGGREPTKLELEYHDKYNLPFIITQELTKPIEDVKFVFERTSDNRPFRSNNKTIKEIVDDFTPSVTVKKESAEYTGREVAIISDCHSMYEPTLAALEDIRRHGITEIYSLGDNIGGGANPCEVFDLLEEYGVISISGNSEYYCHLGSEPFSYLEGNRIKETNWTERKLGKLRISKLKLYPPSIDLFMGNQKLALCHFSNDVRWDYTDNGTYSYQSKTEEQKEKQYLFTNSDEAHKKVNNVINSSKKGDNGVRGYISSKETPLFEGKRVTDYDTIIQGHVHFDMQDKVEDTNIITIRALGMGYEKDPTNTACYYVLKERKDGKVDIEKRLVPFNKNNLLASIKTSDVPNKEHILRFL